MTWTLYSDGWAARWMSISVIVVMTLQLWLTGLGIIKDPALVSSCTVGYDLHGIARHLHGFRMGCKGYMA